MTTVATDMTMRVTLPITVDDVLKEASNMGVDISRDDAEYILRTMHYSAIAQYIDIHIEELNRELQDEQHPVSFDTDVEEVQDDR